MSPSLSRKKPHCHSCGLPMEGHKRPDGLRLCPESPSPPSSLASPPPSTRASPSLSSSLFGSSLSSPPQTPPRQTLPDLPTAPTPYYISPNSSPELSRSRLKREPSLDFPAQGPWHRRNPNWIDPPPIEVKRPPTPAGSVISTVLVDDDGRTIRGCDNDNDYHDLVDMDMDDDLASVTSGFMGQVAETLKADRRVVTMFAARPADQARTQQLAAKRGMHAALMRVAPAAGGGAPAMKKRKIAPAGSWWMVVGRDPAVVSRVVDHSGAQRAMPGVMGDLVMEGPRLTTFLQLILTGLVGGIVAVCGLSYL